MSRRVLAIAALVFAFAVTAAVAVVIWPDRGGESGESAAATTAAPQTATQGQNEAADKADGIAGNSKADTVATPGLSGTPSGVPGASVAASPPVDAHFALQPATELVVQPRLKQPPAAGVLFDVDSGQVLWQRHPTVQHPIASLTKMMTALLITQQDPMTDTVLISPKASGTPGSATGLLPRGKQVPLEPLLDALIMISANDAAVALAEHDAGSVTAFVKEMNARATEMGLACTHFSTPNGLKDRDNYSCPLDLAGLARADLAEPRIAHIAATRYSKPAFPIKGGHLHLANNHYFLQRGLSDVPGARVTGLKTGFTDGAGRCYVTTARLGSHHLGVVLLDSPDPLRQVPALLRAGFESVGELAEPAPKPSKSKQLTPKD